MRRPLLVVRTFNPGLSDVREREKEREVLSAAAYSLQEVALKGFFCR